MRSAWHQSAERYVGAALAGGVDDRVELEHMPPGPLREIYSALRVIDGSDEAERVLATGDELSRRAQMRPEVSDKPSYVDVVAMCLGGLESATKMAPFAVLLYADDLLAQWESRRVVSDVAGVLTRIRQGWPAEDEIAALLARLKGGACLTTKS